MDLSHIARRNRRRHTDYRRRLHRLLRRHVLLERRLPAERQGQVYRRPARGPRHPARRPKRRECQCVR